MAEAAINHYKHDLRSIEFTLYEHMKVQELFELDYYSHLSREECDAVVEQAVRFCEEYMGPINGPADREGCKLENGVVTTPVGFKEAWSKFYELGLSNFVVPMSEGGFQGPSSVGIVLHELFSGANTSLNMYPSLTLGAMELVATFARPEDRERLLEPMMNGRFAGTMCLSEPQAGSDVGMAATKAVKLEGNRYKIKGSKCWISAGDHDLSENIIHLVLARVEGAPPGTQGISLFIVPKYKLNADGSSGELNDVKTASIEHKLGIRASATAVLSFGDDDNCEGFLCGDQENVGMKQMFQMMNNARIIVGVQGLAVASSAYLNALAYAREREQGSSIKAFKDPTAPRVAIIAHSDVRRMLMEMKSKVEGMRALVTKLAKHQDMAAALAEKDPDTASYHKGQVDLLTPIVKAYCSDQSFRVCELAIQTYGGAGYVEDNPVEQYLRDAKIFSIYEGTNHIQALDLVVRKLRGRKGQDLMDFTSNMTEFVQKNSADPGIGPEVRGLGAAGQALQEAGASIMEYMMSGKLDQLTLCASPFLEAMSEITVAHLLLEAAVIAEECRTQDEDQCQEDFDFYAGRVMSAKFFCNFVLPTVHAKVAAIKSADRSALDIPDRGFSTVW